MRSVASYSSKMTGLWTAQGIKIDELDAYLLSCNDKLNLEVKCREFVRLVSSVILTPVVNTHSAIILMKAEQKRKVNVLILAIL